MKRFLQKYSRLKSVWNAREKPFCAISAPRFYFKEYEADVVHYNMLKSVREAILPFSPSESLNKVIKQHVHYKPSQWPDFNNSTRSLEARGSHSCLVGRRGVSPMTMVRSPGSGPHDLAMEKARSTQEASSTL